MYNNLALRAGVHSSSSVLLGGWYRRRTVAVPPLAVAAERECPSEKALTPIGTFGQPAFVGCRVENRVEPAGVLGPEFGASVVNGLVRRCCPSTGTSEASH